MEAVKPLLLLLLLYAVFFLSASVADDGAAMLALAKSFRPPPSDWSTTISIGYCRWTGVRCTAGRVTSISLAAKSLSGSLATEISTLFELKCLALQRNNLAGKIPSFAKLSSLQEIYMDENLFVGVESGAFAGLTSLQILSLSDNSNLTAWGFPSELADSTSLTTIDLDNSNIVGVLPDIFDSFPCLQNLRLSYNNITGVLPPSLAKSSIQNLWINNQLSGMSGTIEVLSSMTSLSQAWLHKNQFFGPIPDLSKSDNLFDLQLRDNQLTGNVSRTLLSLGSLKNVSLDNNKFQGPLPLFPPEVNVSFENNDFCTTKARQSRRLLAAAGGLGYPSILRTNSSASGNNSSRGSFGGRNKSHVLIGVLVAVLIFLAILLFAIYRYFRNKKRSPIQRDPESPENSMLVNDVLNGGGGGRGACSDTALDQPSTAADNSIWLQNSRQGEIPVQVLRDVTNSFREDKILGEGGFGVVYVGEFHDGTKVAIKRMKDPEMVKYFNAEIAVLTKVKHRHLVTLLGYCVNGDEKFLVYEFMPRGDLGQLLFKSFELRAPALTWRQRMRIGLDVAQGVECLHSMPQEYPIHKDLKPANILIGNDRRAKVADFGMVKIAVDGKYSVDSKLKGTFGYLAPEYGCTGIVTPKVDVYAFGVILMEMITGRKTLDNRFPENERELVKWFHTDLIDKQKLEEETIETIHKVAELARDCTTYKPEERPDMRKVVIELKRLVKP